MENNEVNEVREKSISISVLFKYLWKNIILFAAVFVGVFVIGVVYSFAVVKPTYKSTATFAVTVRNDNGKPDYVNSFRLVETAADLVTQDVVLNYVVEQLKAEKDYTISKGGLRGITSVSYAEMNYLIAVTVQHPDREMSQILANSLVVGLQRVTSTEPALKLFFENAITQTSEADLGVYASPNRMMSVLVSGVAGVAIACVVVAIKVLASKKFKSRQEIEERLSSKVLGYFPNNKEKEKQIKADKGVKTIQKVELVESSIKNYELYNALLNNIRYSNIENPAKVIMFTSSSQNEMKSTIVSNLAACIAYNGQKVAIIDLDMRKPSIHKAFKISKGNGIVELFNGECKFEDVIHHTSQGVDIITAGKKILNPMVIIGHKSLPELIKKLKGMYDYVLVDTAPVLACADTIAIAPLCDGVVFNVAMLDAQKKLAEEAVYALRMGRANIIGLNVTKGTESKQDSAYYSRYYYNNYYYGTPETVSEAAAAEESE